MVVIVKYIDAIVKYPKAIVKYLMVIFKNKMLLPSICSLYQSQVYDGYFTLYYTKVLIPNSEVYSGYCQVRCGYVNYIVAITIQKYMAFSGTCWLLSRT